MGKFIVKSTANGGFVFNLLAANSQVICTSQTYKSLASCKAGIESVEKNCNAEVEDDTAATVVPVKNPKYEVYKDVSGQFRFRMKASNGEIIGVSEAYTAKTNCLKGIESVKKNAPDAEIVQA